MREKMLLILPFLLMATVLVLSLPALALNFASITVEGQSDLWTSVIVFLANDVVRTILLILGIAGVVIEVATVGSFGAFGAVGTVAFILYFLGNIWTGSLGVVSILLLVIGIVLIIMEIFVIPGFGISGIAGMVAVLVSLVIASPNPATAVWSVLIALTIAVAIIIFTLKNKKTRKFWHRLILFQKSEKDQGYISADPSLQKYLAAKGVALTVLRPAGSAMINGDKVDVVTSGEFIEPGSEVEVVLIEGTRVVVREIPRENRENGDSRREEK